MKKRRVLEERGISTEKLKRAYEMTKSLRKTAALLHLTTYRVHEEMKRAGLERGRGGIREADRYAHGKTGVVERFRRMHPEIVLPTRAKELAALVPCTLHAAKWYVKRQMRPFLSMLRRLPDIRKKNVALRAVNGHLVPMNSLLSYRVLLRRKVPALQIEAVTRSGSCVLFLVKREDLPQLSALLILGPSVSERP